MQLFEAEADMTRVTTEQTTAACSRTQFQQDSRSPTDLLKDPELGHSDVSYK
jgi:hypothetical protein